MVRAIVGANQDDEGRGKATDMLAKKFDIIIRFQGGSNAGHTIINDYGKFALHLLPSGVFYQHATSIIGNRATLNIPYLIWETEPLVERGVPRPGILVSNRVQVLMPYHVLFDTYEEVRLAGRSFGSTRSGIASFYSGKYAKIGFQVNELLDEDPLREKTYRVCELKNVLLEYPYYRSLLGLEKIIKGFLGCRDIIAPCICDTPTYPRGAIKEGRNILLESQLGSLRGPDHGVYSMVTSSSTLAAYGAIGADISPCEIKDITAVVKAYSGTVGAGAFVSGIFEDETDELRSRGGDGGRCDVTTGRSRRMDWFNAATVRYGYRIRGTTKMALTVLDVLGYLGGIPICVGYKIDGQITREFPTTSRLEKARLVLTRLPDQKCDICGTRRYRDPPESCRKYTEFVEKGIEASISMVSNRPGRDDTIMRR